MGIGLNVTVNESPDGRRIVHYDGQAFELRRSPGEVFCSPHGGGAIHHDKVCGHLTDRPEPPIVYADPDEDLWQRLLASAPRDDREGRLAFGAGAGLRNGQGGVVSQVCRTCTLVPLTTLGGRRIPKEALSTALARFDRAAHAEALAKIKAAIVQVVNDFPMEAWPSMPLENYALGTPRSKESFCYRMEFGTPELGSLGGRHAGKHLIYWRKAESSWYYPAEYDDEREAWRRVRDGFLQAFQLATDGRISDIDTIGSLRSGSALIAKAISCYIPDAVIPVFSREHVRSFLFHLTGENASALEAFGAHERLKQVIDADERFAGWHPYEVGMVLYEWADPRPITTRILKVAPGDEAMYWDDCLTGGYICVGWDDVGDLTAFASEEDFRLAFEVAYSGEYKGYKSKISAKANELWQFSQLKPGDLVVANKGTKEVLAVGTVTEPGYEWRSDRTRYNHTVAVKWDTSFAQLLPEPKAAWGMVTVSKVSADMWKTLREGKATGGESSAPSVISVNPLFEQIADLLARKGQAVLYGPPGTGKTYTSLGFAFWWLATRLPGMGLDVLTEYGTPEFRHGLDTLQKAGYLTQVSFHPAYGYEDFIEGFRPAEGEGGGLRLVLRDGVFKRVCGAASANPERPYLVLIDEINRGDIPKILGELITLLEPDKRGMHVTLPSGGRFAVPSNVYLLGTMNTADRSIRLLDSALRRRFAFHELLPDTDVLDGQKVGDVDLGLLLRELNRRVVKELGRERQIGHSFFMPGGEPVDSESDLAAIVRTEVLPLLQEYAYDDYSMLSRFLGQEIVDVQAHTVAGLSDERLVEALSSELQANAGE
ncbi:AAA family ATPase [Actinomadura bangladeshensis]|uniref:Restriction endonuclease n=1 Tax=Actinomadura bangladeshensis TaxID=453573 RepID=A0A4R4NRS1_9ACTN|nr:AAA family ATPase [Actinomadura bangladeshensis]TDC09902.1 restriction endonuclease [Actinomadura bangladeshensis]